MIDKTTLRKAQLSMLDILIVIDGICRKNDIPYWLDSGTLLGAVRHQGFIPWDDDIDIAMLRPDYNRFIDICKEELPSGYFLQNKATDPHYLQFAIPLKIRKNNCFALETISRIQRTFNPLAHNGLFVDIFPFDKYDKNKITRTIIGHFFSRAAYHKRLSQYAKVKELNMHGKTFLFNRTVNLLVPLSVIEKLEKWLIIRSLALKTKNLSYGIDLFFKKRDFKIHDIFPLREMYFEGIKFKVPNNNLEYLKKIYGKEFMQPTPENKRICHFEKIEFYDSCYEREEDK